MHYGSVCPTQMHPCFGKGDCSTFPTVAPLVLGIVKMVGKCGMPMGCHHS